MRSLNRRAVLAAGTLAAAFAPRTGAAATAVAPTRDARRANAAPFLWGAATAGHQVEGNNVASDIWLLEQVKPTLFSEPSGDACDSFERWREDVEIVRSLGLNAYRFSVEWSRVEPAEGQVSLAALEHYRRIVTACREAGLAPVVTLSHFTSPRWFAAKGGWFHPDAPATFARHCERVVRHMGDQISHVVTFNEPNLQLLGEWGKTPDPAVRSIMDAMLAEAAKASGSDRFSLMNAGHAAAMVAPVLEAHRLVRQAIKTVRSDLPVGLSLAIPDDQAVGPGSQIEDKRAAVYAPFFAEARHDDFLGVQTYGRSLIGAEGPLPTPKDTEQTQTGDEFYPQAIGATIRYAHESTGVPILVTENGLATNDDAQRARFIPAATAAVLTARADGVPVIGYLHWSLLDNFEWFSGYGPKFGLVSVDRTTFKRTIKPSAHVLARIARSDLSR
ncbi:glycoside hydrolase family 1 protein [Brevundimonas sp. G8]|uniref:glycoside hydrolase family 1 protein n=1 Tax=Brevundimonas sp. G8 TaxID=1350776 RepID=UPI0012F0F5D1|nr:family 1 glycosylhydrolase [Brevundimonas sp. G8]VXB24861.1 Glycosyl hydrolase family 1 [Brevundimonas sp. G8]